MTRQLSEDELLATYLAGTPFLSFFDATLPFSLPMSARFEHTYIVAGAGHGKTQTLQHLMAQDLKTVAAGKASLA